MDTILLPSCSDISRDLGGHFEYETLIEIINGQGLRLQTLIDINPGMDK